MASPAVGAGSGVGPRTRSVPGPWPGCGGWWRSWPWCDVLRWGEIRSQRLGV